MVCLHSHGGPLERKTRAALALGLGALILLPLLADAAIRKGKTEEYRTISTNIYDLVVQKNARVDIQWLTGEPIIDNACPMIQLDGDEKPKVLAVAAVQSNRMPVDDPLGMGQGMILMGKDCEWRLCVYPGQPFFTAQIVYTNPSKHPVRVARLIPWVVGEGPGSGISLGPGPEEVRFLGNGQNIPLDPPSKGEPGLSPPLKGDQGGCYPEVTRGRCFSPGGLAGFNGTSNRGLLAGYLTANRAHTQVLMDRSEKAGAVLFDVFRAECVYNPPVELQPGESLASGRIYVAVIGAEPLPVLESYGRAVALVNKITGAPASPSPLEGLFGGPLCAGRDIVPEWRSGKTEGPWGCVESLSAAIRRYYLSPITSLPGSGIAFFGHDSARAQWKVEEQPKLTWSQSVAWFTGAALTGEAVKSGDPVAELNPSELEVLRKLSPSLHRPARPLDLFQDGPPSLWSLPVEGKAGRWHILAVFNWDEKEPKTFTVPFDALGLDPGAYYTVYEFWGETYYGTAQDRLDVQTPPGSVLLFGLRKYEDHPMFLASNRHFTQGAIDHESIEWKAADRLLYGRFNAIADTNYRLRVLAHEPYEYREAVVSADVAKTTIQGRVICMEFHCDANGPVDWQVQF